MKALCRGALSVEATMANALALFQTVPPTLTAQESQ